MPASESLTPDPKRLLVFEENLGHGVLRLRFLFNYY